MSSLSRPACLIFLCIVVSYASLGALYSSRVPLWNAPDEPSHFNYVRYLAETRQLPVLQVGDYDQSYLERLKAERFPPGLSVDSLRYESHQPPLYYALAALVYAPFASHVVEARALALRLFSVTLGALALWMAFGIARILFPKDASLSLGVVALIAFIPMRLAIYSSVNNDVLAELVVSGALLTLMSRWAQPRPRTHLALLGMIVGLAMLTKVIAYALVLVVPFGLFLSEVARLRQLPGASRTTLTRSAKTAGLASLAVGAIAALISGWWFVRNALVYGWPDIFGLARHDLVVAGQPLTGALTAAVAKDFVVVTFHSFWGQFGWMGVLLDDRIYVALEVLTAFAALGVLLCLGTWRHRTGRMPPDQIGPLALLALTAFLVFGFVVQYNLKYVQTQGRYLFPALVPIAVYAVIGLREVLAEEHRGLLFALLFGGLCVLDVVSLFGFIVPALSA